MRRRRPLIIADLTVEAARAQREQRRAYLRQWRAEQRLKGLCSQCSDVAAEGSSRCAFHQRRAREIAMEAREARERKMLKLVQRRLQKGRGLQKGPPQKP